MIFGRNLIAPYSKNRPSSQGRFPGVERITFNRLTKFREFHKWIDILSFTNRITLALYCEGCPLPKEQRCPCLREENDSRNMTDIERTKNKEQRCPCLRGENYSLSMALIGIESSCRPWLIDVSAEKLSTLLHIL